MNSTSSRRRIVAATISLATGAAAAAALGLPAAAAAATGANYVALGDSYSSGTGTRAYINDGTSCQRSVYAYPALDAGALRLDLNFRACSGATVADVTGAQLPALSESTDYVTISVGGNDAGFASVLTTCALPGWMSNCNRAVDGAQKIINNTLPTRLVTLYAAIRAKAPTAQVIVVGYPHIFNGQDCNALTWFSPSEESRLNATADLLNAKTASVAAAAGFSFVNPTTSFVGHAVCDRTEWINGLSYPITESYHPNRTGQASGYAALTKPVFEVPVSTTAKARKISAASLAKSAAQYRSLDAAITPKEFIAPDLSTPAAKAAAKAAGVDLSSRASIDRADRLATVAQDRAHAFER